MEMEEKEKAERRRKGPKNSGKVGNMSCDFHFLIRKHLSPSPYISVMS